MSTPASSRSSQPRAPAAYASATARSAASRLRPRSAISRYATLASAWLGIALSGCYLGHVTAGEARLLLARQPIDALLADAATPDDLRTRLALVSHVREFAAGLGLRVGHRYTDYAPWPGDRVVTAVVATRPGEVEAAGFWFPIVGRVPYKGYFDPALAQAEAERLRAQGLDVCESGVPAYSTLGWFDDPVTGPMLREPEGDLVETLFHELVHATFFAAGDADWSEGVASFVGEEARVRFYARTEGPDAGRRERSQVAERRSLREALLRARAEVEHIYAERPPGPERDAERAGIDTQLREDVARLLRQAGETEVGVRVARLRSNDACLALAATYAGLTPCLDALLDAQRGDLAALVGELDAASQAEDPRRTLFGASGCTATPG